MKKLLSLALALCLSFVFCIPANATEKNKPSQIDINSTLVEKVAKFENIPLYITILDSGTTLTDEAKETITDSINAINIQAKCNPSNMIEVINNPDFQVRLISEIQKQNILSSPIYSLALSQIEDLIDNGVNISYVNLFAFSPDILQSRASDPNDEDAWEDISDPLGSYGGYEFRKMMTSASVESTTVDFGDIDPRLNWTAIGEKGIEVVFEHFVNNAFVDVIKGFVDGISSLFEIYENPLKITYGNTEGYLRASASGQLYIQSVLISDELDRVDGYSYYPWGVTQMFDCALRVDAKYPYEELTNNEYLYRYPSHSYSIGEIRTPGYDGNRTLYKNIIDKYTNTAGYFTYDESIDVYNAIAELVD